VEEPELATPLLPAVEPIVDAPPIAALEVPVPELAAVLPLPAPAAFAIVFGPSGSPQPIATNADTQTTNVEEADRLLAKLRVWGIGSPRC
jgi:hypothetical protein